MAVKIRLRRVGATKQPSYRVVIADARAPRDGRIVENIGWYNPLTDPSTIRIDADRATYWLGVGAQPTESVRSLFQRAGILERSGAQAAGAHSTGTSQAPKVASAAPVAVAEESLATATGASEASSSAEE